VVFVELDTMTKGCSRRFHASKAAAKEYGILKLFVYYAADNPNFAPLSEPLVCSVTGLFENIFYIPIIQISFIFGTQLDGDYR